MTSTASVAGDDAKIFQALEGYDWDTDKEFQGGLQAILGPNPSPSQAKDLTLRAQCFYLARKRGIAIDFDAYKGYLASRKTQSSTSSYRSQSQPHSSSTSETPPAVPTHGSREPLYNAENTSMIPEDISSSTQDLSIPPPPSAIENKLETLSAPPSNPEQAPYPASFAQIVAMIQSGEPIPGIVDIPPIVLHGQGSKPTLKKRRKPWEMHKSEEEVQGDGEGTFGDHRDRFIPQELPEDEDGATQTAQA